MSVSFAPTSLVWIFDDFTIESAYLETKINDGPDDYSALFGEVIVRYFDGASTYDSLDEWFSTASGEHNFLLDIAAYLREDLDTLIETLVEGGSHALYYKDYRIEPEHLDRIRGLRSILSTMELQHRFNLIALHSL
jgi:hypothetical protein